MTHLLLDTNRARECGVPDVDHDAATSAFGAAMNQAGTGLVRADRRA